MPALATWACCETCMGPQRLRGAPGTQVCPHDPPLPSSPAILGLTLSSWDILLAVCSSSVPGLCTRSFRFHALPLPPLEKAPGSLASSSSALMGAMRRLDSSLPPKEEWLSLGPGALWLPSVDMTEPVPEIMAG